MLEVARERVAAGEFSRAAEDLRLALVSPKPHYKIIALAGLCFLGRGLPDRAMEVLTQGLSVWPENPWILKELMKVAEASGQDFRSVGARALSAIPGFRGSEPDHELLLLRADVLYRLDEFHEARAVLREALARGAEPAEVYSLLGNIERRDENPTAAYKYFNEALRYREQPDDLACLAHAASILGRHGEAQEVITRALSIAPRSALVNIMAFLVALTLHDKDLASEYLGRAGTCECYLYKDGLDEAKKRYNDEILYPTMGSGGCAISVICVTLTLATLGEYLQALFGSLSFVLLSGALLPTYGRMLENEAVVFASSERGSDSSTLGTVRTSEFTE